MANTQILRDSGLGTVRQDLLRRWSQYSYENPVLQVVQWEKKETFLFAAHISIIWYILLSTLFFSFTADSFAVLPFLIAIIVGIMLGCTHVLISLKLDKNRSKALGDHEHFFYNYEVLCDLIRTQNIPVADAISVKQVQDALATKASLLLAEEERYSVNKTVGSAIEELRTNFQQAFYVAKRFGFIPSDGDWKGIFKEGKRLHEKNLRKAEARSKKDLANAADR